MDNPLATHNLTPGESMSDRSDLMEVALRLQECKQLVMSPRFVSLRVLLDKATDLVAMFQDEQAAENMDRQKHVDESYWHSPKC